MYDTAAKGLLRLPKGAQGRIMGTIESLANEPRPHGCKKLKGESDYAVRVGDYRIIYSMDDAAQIVTVLKVKHRREVYRDL